MCSTARPVRARPRRCARRSFFMLPSGTFLSASCDVAITSRALCFNRICPTLLYPPFLLSYTLFPTAVYLSLCLSLSLCVCPSCRVCFSRKMPSTGVTSPLQNNLVVRFCKAPPKSVRRIVGPNSWVVYCGSSSRTLQVAREITLAYGLVQSGPIKVGHSFSSV